MSADRRSCATRARRVGLVGVLLVVAASGAAGSLPAMEPEAAVEAGRKALRQTSFPWYDGQQDRLQRIEVQPPADPAAHRDSTWQAKPAAPRDLSWLESLQRWVGTIARWIAWVGMAVLLLVLIALLARAFAARELRQVQPAEGESEPEADQIEKLPFQVRPPRNDLLAEARRHYEQGDYAQAIIYLFSYKLLALDRHGLIHLTRGKTNRQYSAELLAHPLLRQMLQHTMVAFEEVFFGHHRMERERFESCWRQLDEFHQRIQQASMS
jgi:hypothetical protein